MSGEIDDLEQPPSAPAEDVPWRLQLAVYGIGLFSTTMFYMAAVVVPLWLVTLESSPFLIGLVLGSRHFLPLFLSIHGGALIDRIGGRRVMMFFALVGMAVPLAYPVLPFVWAVLMLQMIAGLSDSMGWLGAQVMVGKYMKGRAVYTGRLSASVRLGHLFAPPLIGWVWDTMGPWAAFIGLSIWGCGCLAAASMLPGPGGETGAERIAATASRPRVRLGELIPRPSEYLDAFRLLSIPAMAVAIMAGMLSHVGGSLQSTFYVVWLDQIGISGTQIGILLAASSIAAVPGAFLAGPASRMKKPYLVMLAAILVSVLAVVMTPLFGTVIALLMLGTALRGGTNGINQPLLISTVLRSVGPEIQGRAVGMRGTANRVSSIVSPIVMGGLAELAGIEAAFYIIGFMTCVLMGMLWRYIAVRPELANLGADVH